VPEVMLHLRNLGLLELDALTASGLRLGDALDWWEGSLRRRTLREMLRQRDGVEPDDVILSRDAARRRGFTGTVCFLGGNLAPQGAIVKSTAIDKRTVGADGVYRLCGPARIFTSEALAIAAVKGRGPRPLQPGEVLVMVGLGPRGTGMEEVYQVTAALKYLPFASQLALITDARFSGVSTGPCVGHVAPEALAGGPIGRLRDGDLVEVVVDTFGLTGRLEVGRKDAAGEFVADDAILAGRPPHPDLAPDPALPDATRLWAALQEASGGPWNGAVYDVDSILRVMEAGRRALGKL
jgi:xylonate dehydratase